MTLVARGVSTEQRLPQFLMMMDDRTPMYDSDFNHAETVPAGGCTTATGPANRLSAALWFVISRVVASCAGLYLITAIATADQSANAVRTALGDIFSESHTIESAYGIHVRALGMSAEDRLQYLSRWVLPNADHAMIRFGVGFTPTNPADAVGLNISQSGVRVPSGGEVVSPVLDLVDVAAELGRLDELQLQLTQLQAANIREERAKLSLLCLVELKRQQPDSALKHIDALLKTSFSDSPLIEEDRLPELLVFLRGMAYEKVRDVIRDPAYRIALTYRAPTRRSPFQLHFTAVANRLMASGGSTIENDPDLTRWQPVSREYAMSRGRGCPTALWQPGEAQVANLASHDHDYLYLGVPLQGNFEVECDLSAFSWSDTQVCVAGTWLFPRIGHDSMLVGNLRNNSQFVDIEPRLTKIRDWVHFRTVVQDQVARIWLNGRLVHTTALGDDFDPWLSIRSNDRTDGGVRDLRISGDPVIPKTIRLTAHDDLEGWFPYFSEGISPTHSNWRQLGDVKSGGGIIGGRRTDVPKSSYKESLLNYHRPMLEDGSIEYEFFYREDDIDAHPALDRLAFLIRPDGVYTHRLTDGEFDQTENRPDDATLNPEHQRINGQLPLSGNEWNRLRLKMAGNTVSIELNGQLVFKRPVESGNQRTFGLFHYSDQTELRVRNVRWTGDWLRELPAVDQQQLAGPGARHLDEQLPELTAVYEHDFAANGLPRDHFNVLRGDAATHLIVESNGLRAIRPGTGGYRNATVAPTLAVQGDFDITVAYNSFEANAVPGGSSTIALLAIMDNAERNECLMMRRGMNHLNRANEQLVQCCSVANRPDGQRRSYPAHTSFEAPSGRLRLARRGDQMHYLFAEGDSDYFRLLHSEKCPTDDLQSEGLRLMTQIHGDGGSTGVVWTHLTIRAEKLTGLATQDAGALLQTLNDDRSRLPARFRHDFVKQAPDDDTFYRWVDTREWKAGRGGLLIVSRGTEEWTSSGLSLLKRIEGDLDVTIEFDPRVLALPAEGGRSSVYLQIGFADDMPSQVSSIFARDPQNNTMMIAQVREPAPKGGYNYRGIGDAQVGRVTSLRYARRGKRLYWIVRGDKTTDEMIVASADVDDGPLNTSAINVLLHTSGEGRQSEMVLKNIDVRAKSIVGSSPKPQQPKGLFESLLDAFD